MKNIESLKFLIILAPPVAVLTALGIFLWKESRRRHHLAALARAIQYRFVEINPTHGSWIRINTTPPADPPFGWPGTSLFSQGRRHALRFYLERDEGKRQIYIFDHAYATGSKNHVARQTVIAFKDPALKLPAFTLQPEHFIHRLASVLGYQDIDFPESPEFSRRYLLQGENEVAIREFLHIERRNAWVRENVDMRMEANGEWVIFFKLRAYSSVKQMQHMLHKAQHLYGLLVGF